MSYPGGNIAQGALVVMAIDDASRKHTCAKVRRCTGSTHARGHAMRVRCKWSSICFCSVAFLRRQAT